MEDRGGISVWTVLDVGAALAFFWLALDLWEQGDALLRLVPLIGALAYSFAIMYDGYQWLLEATD